MGMDITVKILKWDRTKCLWREVKLYNENKEQINPYPFRNFELFSILNGTTNLICRGGEGYEIPTSEIQMETLPHDIKTEIEESKKWCYSFKEINLADLKVYLSKVKKVKFFDDEYNDHHIWVDNPVKAFIERIEYYIDFADHMNFCTVDSDIKILFWFDN